MVCKHIWYKDWSYNDITKYYCMRCLKQIRIKNGKHLVLWKDKTLDKDDFINIIKERINENSLDFDGFRKLLSEVLDDEQDKVSEGAANLSTGSCVSGSGKSLPRNKA